MTPLHTLARRALMSPLFCAALLTPFFSATASTMPVQYFAAYTGQGNVSVFDAAAGTGGWVGSIDEVPDPAIANPLSLVSVVLFTLDRAAQTLMSWRWQGCWHLRQAAAMSPQGTAAKLRVFHDPARRPACRARCQP